MIKRIPRGNRGRKAVLLPSASAAHANEPATAAAKSAAAHAAAAATHTGTTTGAAGSTRTTETTAVRVPAAAFTKAPGPAEPNVHGELIETIAIVHGNDRLARQRRK